MPFQDFYDLVGWIATVRLRKFTFGFNGIEFFHNSTSTENFDLLSVLVIRLQADETHNQEKIHYAMPV